MRVILWQKNRKFERSHKFIISSIYGNFIHLGKMFSALLTTLWQRMSCVIVFSLGKRYIHGARKSWNFTQHFLSCDISRSRFLMLPHESALPRTIYYLPCSFIFIASNEELCWLLAPSWWVFFLMSRNFPSKNTERIFTNNKNIFMCEWNGSCKNWFFFIVFDAWENG